MGEREEKTELRGVKAPVAIASAGVVALAAALGVWSLENGSAGAAEEGAGGRATAAAESMCGLPGGDQTEIEDLTDVEWTFVGSVEAPSIPEAGPGRIVDGGFRQCYAHTPTGALVAAANVLAMGSAPHFTRAFNEELVAEGPGRDSVLKDLKENGVHVDQSGIRHSIEGYRLVEYGPEHARIDLAVKGSDGTISSVTTDFRWEEGDWKVELSPDGQPIVPAAELADMDGYTPWTAERPRTAVW